MKIGYKECSAFIKNNLKITLFPYQEEMLKAFCEGKEVRSARCVGRTFVADAVGQYVAHTLGENNYTAEPDVSFPYHYAVKHNLMTKDMVEHIRSCCDSDTFKREMLCK